MINRDQPWPTVIRRRALVDRGGAGRPRRTNFAYAANGRPDDGRCRPPSENAQSDTSRTAPYEAELASFA